MNGKGDSPRPTNLKVYRENYDAINWSPLTIKHAEWHLPCVPSESKPATGKETHLAFMRSMGFECASEEEAYELRGLLDM